MVNSGFRRGERYAKETQNGVTSRIKGERNEHRDEVVELVRQITEDFAVVNV